MEEHQGCFYALPKDLLSHVVSFLDLKSALKLTQLNSSFGRDVLPLSVLHSPKTLVVSIIGKYGSANGERNVPQRGAWIPVLFPGRTHSIALTCDWHVDAETNNDEGGRLFVVAVPVEDDPNENALESMGNGRIVYKSPRAPPVGEALTMSFSYDPAMSYYLWYNVGGPGPTRLRVNNIKVHMLIHDCKGQWIGQNYRVLCFNKNGLRTGDYNELSLQLLRTIAVVAQDEMSPATAQHLESLIGPTIDVSPPSMKALEELVTAVEENNAKTREHKEFDYAQGAEVRAIREAERARQRNDRALFMQAIRADVEERRRRNPGLRGLAAPNIPFDLGRDNNDDASDDDEDN